MTEKQDKNVDIEKLVEPILKKAREHKIKPPLKINTGRKQKRLHRIPKDVDFEMKDGNTTFEVIGHFNPDGDEYFFNQIIRKLGYKQND